MPQRVSGKASWFGGPNDAGNTGTALGVSDSKPGIAVYNRKTLGGYWRVTAPNGKTKILQQTDIGPAPWTGKKIDFTSGAVKQFGYSERNFPTGAGAHAEYLGKKKPSGDQGVSQAISGTSSQPSTPSSPSASSEQKRALLNALIAKRNPNSMLIKLGVV